MMSSKDDGLASRNKASNGQVDSEMERNDLDCSIENSIKARNDLAESVDFAVIGSGMAGASIAYELSSRGASVLVLEMEEHAGYHTTGRSAAFYMAAYGNDIVRSITIASKSFYDNPPPGFCDYPLLRSCGAMYIAREDQLPQLHRMYEQVRPLLPNVSIVDKSFVLEKVPQLKPDYVKAGFWEPTSMEIDVAALLQGYIKFATRQGAQFIYQATVQSLELTQSNAANVKNKVWTIKTNKGDFQAKTIINSAGAWADEVAKMAGADAVGLVPKRRSVCVAKTPANISVVNWPLTLDIDEQFYFKPDGGNILITPADETPMPPMDAYPLEIDIALGVERFQQAMDVEIKQLVRQWAGLRTFSEDRSPVVGYDAKLPQFFWMAGQGGYGIQMAPALAKLAAALALKEDGPHRMISVSFDEKLISPKRYQVSDE